MIRFIIRRQEQYEPQGAHLEDYFTVDADAPELEEALRGGGQGVGSFDIRTVFAAEVLPPVDTSQD